MSFGCADVETADVTTGVAEDVLVQVPLTAMIATA